jgi:hypothetical protein
VLRDPVAEFRTAALHVVQVEPAQDRAIAVDEHPAGAGAGLLLSQQGPVPVGELGVELVAAVGDRGPEIGAVRQFEGRDRRGVASIQPLQLGPGP